MSETTQYKDARDKDIPMFRFDISKVCNGFRSNSFYGILDKKTFIVHMTFLTKDGSSSIGSISKSRNSSMEG